MRMHKILDIDKLTLITDSQELAAIFAHLGITQAADEITGALVNLDAAVDGLVEAIYLSESSKPWSIYSEWERPEYYADEIPEELDLQDGE